MCKRNKGGPYEPPSFDLCAKVEGMMEIVDAELAQGGDGESNDTVAAIRSMIRTGEAIDDEGAIIELAIQRVHERGYGYDSEQTKDDWLADNGPEQWEKDEEADRRKHDAD